MQNYLWYITFHGGDDSNDWNNIHAFTANGDESNPKKVLDKTTLPANIELNELRGMTKGPNGNLFVANAHKPYSQILEFSGNLNASGKHSYVSTFVAAPGTHPFQAIFGPDQNLYIANQDTYNVTRYYGPDSQHPGTPVEPNGVFVEGLTSVRGICFGPDGNFYVVDEDANQIYVCDPVTGTILNSISDPDGHLDSPVHIVFKNKTLYIGNSGKNNILVFNLNDINPEVKVLIHKSDANLDKPSGLGFDPDGKLYVASRKGKAINRYVVSEDGQSATFEDVFITSKELDDYPEFLLLTL